MQPHQREVTKILQYAAQACHDLVPPDTLEPVIRAVATNFVSERNSVEVMTVGLNAIREICARAPLAIDEDLLHDLVMYRTYRDKNVSTAARSLITLYRQVIQCYTLSAYYTRKMFHFLENLYSQGEH